MAWEIGTIILGIVMLRTLVIKCLQPVAQQIKVEIVPTRELIDLLLVFAGAVLLILPGLIADALGF